MTKQSILDGLYAVSEMSKLPPEALKAYAKTMDTVALLSEINQHLECLIRLRDVVAEAWAEAEE